MLHTLPSSVLLAITDKLCFNDKLNVCKTCRRLHKQLSKTNLYETVIDYKNAETTVRLFQNKTLDGTQVKVLEINMDDLTDDTYSKLADIFPNVTRVITFRRWRGYGSMEESKKREDHINKPLLKWKDTLTKYESSCDSIHFRSELFRSVFPLLNDLTIWRSTWFTGREKGFDPLRLSKSISNAPMLTKLTLHLCDISIDSLEEIHKGCPHISSIDFISGAILVDKKKLPSTIAPSKSVLRLKLSADCFDKYGLFLDYITKKYLRLQDLDIHIFDNHLFHPFSSIDFFYPSHLDHYEENKDMRSFWEEEQIATLESYKAGGSAFLSRLPKSINALKLDLSIFDSTIEQLAKGNMALSILNLTGVDNDDDYNPPKLDQFGYFKSLNSLQDLTIYLGSEVQSLDLEFISRTVTTLNVRLLDEDFYIDWIFSMFPSLESLKIKSERDLLIEKDINDTMNAVKRYTKLRKLDLVGNNLNPDLLNHIKTISPNVEEFKGSVTIGMGCTRDQQLNCNLDFTGWNLVSLEIHVYSNHNPKCYTIISTLKGTQLVLEKTDDNTFFPVQDDIDFTENIQTCYITCNVAENFSLNKEKFIL